MGVAAAVTATLLGGYLQGRAQQQAYNAQAQQAETNAQIAYQNAEKLQSQAERQAQNNSQNEEQRRRRLLAQQGSNIANVGAAGITMSGSALSRMEDSAFAQEQDLAIERYNARQQVDNIFQQSTDNVNQGDIYSANASAYRKAGKRSMMNSMLQSGLTLAANLYGGNSSAASSGSSKTISYGSYSNNPYSVTVGGNKITGMKNYTKYW